MRRRALGAGAMLALLCGCSQGSSPVAVGASPVNPSPLAHLTYDCSVLAAAEASGSSIVPVFYLEPFDDGGSGMTRMCAVDWNGKLRREIPRGLAIRQSADGGRLLAVDYPIVNDAPAGYLVVDRENKVLERLSTVWRDEALWADDSQHLCYIEDSNASGRGGVAYLELAQPPASPRRVATVGFITYLAPSPRNGNGGVPTAFIAGPHLLACSVRADRAVILDPEKGTAIVIRLSDGTQLNTHSFGRQFYPYGAGLRTETLVASRDGAYVADNVDGATSVPVLDALSNKVVTQIPAAGLSAFSWNGTLAVIRTKGQLVEVIEWKTGRLVLRFAGAYASARPRPDTEDFLIGMPSTRHQFGVDLYVVQSDGSAFQVARSVEIIDQ